MANSNNTPEQELSSNNSPENPIDAETNNPLFSKTTLLILKLTPVIALVCIVLALYNSQSNNQLKHTLVNENKNLATEIRQLKKHQNLLEEQNNATKDILQQAQKKLDTEFTSINKQLQASTPSQAQQEQRWLLLKVRYYLELAQVNAHWSNSNDSTIVLLQQADTLLMQLNQPKIFNIRQIIAKEIAQLKAMQSLDVAGMLSQLDAIQASLASLALQTPLVPNAVIDENKSITSPRVSNWKERFKDSINILGKLVVVRRSDEEIKPLLSPLFGSILKESIRLNIQEAQWAILNNNESVYQLGLKQAVISIKKGFNQDTKNVAALLKQLTQLQQIKIVQARPVIGEALPLLNQLIDTKELDSKNKGEQSL